MVTKKGEWLDGKRQDSDGQETERRRRGLEGKGGGGGGGTEWEGAETG